MSKDRPASLSGRIISSFRASQGDCGIAQWDLSSCPFVIFSYSASSEGADPAGPKGRSLLFIARFAHLFAFSTFSRRKNKKMSKDRPAPLSWGPPGRQDRLASLSGRIQKKTKMIRSDLLKSLCGCGASARP